MAVPSSQIPKIRIKPDLIYAAEPKYYIVIDSDVNGKPIYIGRAIPGSVKSDAVWQIRKLFYSGDYITDIKYADGNQAFDNIWDNRGSLSYS